jgi:PAS domain S-box-containing protein
MKLRLILFVLSLVAVLSAATGGFLYYDSLKTSAVEDAERQALERVQTLKKGFSAFLSENIKPVRSLAGLEQLQQGLAEPNEAAALERANGILDHFNRTLKTEVCYLMDRRGETIASSNRMDEDSFVGQNFAFRPYFQSAIQGRPATYLALGTTSGRRGAYYSHPIWADDRPQPIGVAVIKASIELIERELVSGQDEIVLVTDPHGVVFISNQERWLYHSIQELSDDRRDQIARSLQFGEGPWNWIGIRMEGDRHALDREGNGYLIHRTALDLYPGWDVIYLRSLAAIGRTVSDPLIRIAGPSILALCVLVGGSVFFLYRKASVDILRRQAAETALRESEERHRSLYLHTPAMLHSIDTNGRLVSVSDYWLELLGYQREEVVGRRLTDFFTESSRRYAEAVVIPEFFKTGVCKDIPYQFIKKNGEMVDILLSAITDRAEGGKPIRSLAVSIDVTERKRAEEALQRAQQELRRYSQELERQVRKRTQEVTSILKYTPAVVSIKDREGRYSLVNSRFEELFALRNEEVQGKTDHAIFPSDVAEQFCRNDRRVLSENRSCQAEEQVWQPDGIRTYLSVKFPVYDETATVSGICTISTDISEVKKAQEQLRRLSGSIMDRQEKERKAIARELHDELGQLLTALRMDSVWLRDRLKDADAKASERALTMCTLIDKTIEGVRGMAIRLRPDVLDTLGLVDALEWVTSDFEKRTSITCFFQHRGVPPNIKDTLSTAAYRITQEALTNVARHARASRVDVSLGAEDGMLTLTVSDDGCGFDLQHLAEFDGLGLAGMRERASLVGGSLAVRSRPLQGTRVRFSVAVQAEKAD